MAGFAQSLFHPVPLLATFVHISRDTTNVMGSMFNLLSTIYAVSFTLPWQLLDPQPDINAIARTNLRDVRAALPLGFFVIGDNAYPASEHFVPVFVGADCLNPDNDNLNYFISQCRIRVEMAFGMMTQSFGVLARPLRIHPRHILTLMETIAHLHN
jgi:hypothetical protein